jgi:hypothetical protein
MGSRMDEEYCTLLASLSTESARPEAAAASVATANLMLEHTRAEAEERQRRGSNGG